MDVDELESKLRDEGFTATYIWRDAPEAFYPDHTHARLTAHIVLHGQMTLTVNGKAHTFHAGDRCDVPVGAVHSARMGPQGCQYLIGEK